MRFAYASGAIFILALLNVLWTSALDTALKRREVDATAGLLQGPGAGAPRPLFEPARAPGARICDALVFGKHAVAGLGRSVARRGQRGAE